MSGLLGDFDYTREANSKLRHTPYYEVQGPGLSWLAGH